MQEPTIPFLKVLGDNQGTRSKDDFDPRLHLFTLHPAIY
jgi:hypothetical protein